MIRNSLEIALVPRELGFAWASGDLEDGQVWAHPSAGTGTCLFIKERHGLGGWRALAKVCRALKPTEICFRTSLHSQVRRCKKFGAVPLHTDNSEKAHRRWWAEGEALQSFLRSIHAI